MNSGLSVIGFGLLAFWAALPPDAWAASYQDTILGDDPIAYWRLGESSSSSTAVDSTGHGHNGSYSALANLQFGIPGALIGDSDTGLLGTGSPGFPVTPVLIGNDPVFDLGSALTLEAWFKSTAGIGQNQAFIDRRSSVPTSFYSYYLGTAFGQGCIAVVVEGQRGLLCAGPNVYDQQWHHIVGTYDGEEIRLYLDGSLQGVLPQTGSVDTSTREVGIGSYANADNVLYGSLDEVAIYATPLTSAKIKEHYDVGLGLVPPPLTATPSPTATPTDTAAAVNTPTQTSTVAAVDTATHIPSATPTPDPYSLVLDVVRLRIDGGSGNGRIVVRGIVSDVSTAGNLEATLLAGLAAVRVSDEADFDTLVTLQGCRRTLATGRVVCLSVDRRTRAMFRPIQAPFVYAFKLTKTRLTGAETGATRPIGPVRVHLHQSATDREDRIEMCIGKGQTRLYCSE
jgi:hypothetical protein